MRAFVVLDFFPYHAKGLAWENVSEMSYFVSSGTQNHNSISQSMLCLCKRSQKRRSVSTPPGSDHKLRSSLQQDSASCEKTTPRRSLRLLAKNTNVTCTSSQPEKTYTASASSPAR